MQKTFQELDLNNAFLFAAALEDSETCQLVLEIILGYKIPKIKVHSEHNILVSSDFRSVRFDIYASDEMQVSYNVEAQNANEGNLPKRSRYHQAEMDVSFLKPGMNFNDLKPSYIIFICTFDPFDKGLYRYTFKQRCDERNLELGDEAYRIFLNTKGTNADEVPKELVHFLNYMEQSTNEYVIQTKDDSITRLHEKVTELKKWRELEERYMTGEEWAQQRERIAKAEGEVQGEIRGEIKGKADTLISFLKELNSIPEELMEKIVEEKDLETLNAWIKSASKATSIEEFIVKM